MQAALGVSDAILEAAALGFLGLGAQPPTPEWGSMLADSREFIRSDPWIVTLPGLAILITVVAINLDRRRPARRARSEDAAELMATPLLEIRNLTVAFATRSGAFKAVDGIDLTVDRNEVLAIVGESGSGKSVAMLAVMGLLPPTATVTADRMAFDGADLLSMTAAERRRIAGKDMAMIFQEPMSSLNPCFTVGFQIDEALKTHLGLDRDRREGASSSSWPRSAFPIPSAAATPFPTSFRAA